MKPVFQCPCCNKIVGLAKLKLIKIKLFVKPTDPILINENASEITMMPTKTFLGKTRIRISKNVQVCVNCAVDTFVGTFPVKRVYRRLFTTTTATQTSRGDLV